MSEPTDPRDPTVGRIVGPGFHRRVYDLVRQVPAGRLTTYGDVATFLGSPRVARQVGWALAALRDGAAGGEGVPWHRVINSRARISHRGDTWRAEDQYLRLAAEGIDFDAGGEVVGFEALRWRDFL